MTKTPLGSSIEHVRRVIERQYSSAAFFAPVETVLTESNDKGPGSFAYPHARLILTASVHSDSSSSTHVLVHWVFDESDVLVGAASRRLPISLSRATKQGLW